MLRPGLRLLGQARLSPPAAPSEPGGFDYRRVAWFERIGAVGYARTPMLETEGSDGSGWRQLAFRIRMASSAHIQRLVPGQNGAFTSAILTGDRSGIDRSVEEALRISSLYHIVSISGLHMTLLAAAVFAMIRYGLALVPRLALRWPLKKIAAVAALVAGGGVPRHLRLRRGDAAVLRDDRDGAGRGAARPAGADHALGGAGGADRAADRAGEPDPGGVPDVLRRHGRADRGLRGAARPGLVAAYPDLAGLALRQAGASASR